VRRARCKDKWRVVTEEENIEEDTAKQPMLQGLLGVVQAPYALEWTLVGAESTVKMLEGALRESSVFGNDLRL
jgi:hypothetical protein